MLTAIPVFPEGSGHDDPAMVLLAIVVLGAVSLLVFFGLVGLVVRLNRRRR